MLAAPGPGSAGFEEALFTPFMPAAQELLTQVSVLWRFLCTGMIFLWLIMMVLGPEFTRYASQSIREQCRIWVNAFVHDILLSPPHHMLLLSTALSENVWKLWKGNKCSAHQHYPMCHTDLWVRAGFCGHMGWHRNGVIKRHDIKKNTGNTLKIFF